MFVLKFCILLIFYRVLAGSVKGSCGRITGHILYMMHKSVDEIPVNYKLERSAGNTAISAVKIHFKTYCQKELTMALSNDTKVGFYEESQDKLKRTKITQTVLTNFEKGFKNICTASMFSVYHTNNNSPKTRKVRHAVLGNDYLNQVVKNGVGVIRSNHTVSLIVSLFPE